ncbi:uncharacterized protein BKA55DRAFT_574682 [Fusarium redolens]|uniref:Uncharacterized protein n=1 Tax=Fusarium redolens TaxID=48865 RepID=A0A9P9K425_FUSRE|nr:uncharacterized protein BKA55DRAFT_574682 [Fusarium redolens]KAH7243401.1 hypothetical protein BKA55DRAFT_574682 [Fusarium redolens]
MSAVSGHFCSWLVHVTMSHHFNAIINIRKHHSHHNPISSKVAHPFLDPSPTTNSKSRGNGPRLPGFQKRNTTCRVLDLYAAPAARA